jgi:hypothetical protein
LGFGTASSVWLARDRTYDSRTPCQRCPDDHRVSLLLVTTGMWPSRFSKDTPRV